METHELVIHRTNYSAIVTLDGAARTWMWEIPVEPPTHAVEHHVDGDTVYYRIEEGGDWYMRECARRPMNPTMLLAQLTFEEARLLLGYCQHLTDQLATHVGFLLVAMNDALAIHAWDAIASLNHEVTETLGAKAVGHETARLCYEALDREPEQRGEYVLPMDAN